MNLNILEFLKHRSRLLPILLLLPLAGMSADPYRIFRGDGSAATIADILQAAEQAEVVFVGESHDDPTAHELELLLLQKLADLGSVQLSLEMFETDVQLVLDEYLQGQVTEEHLLKSGRAWNNYKTDYRPMVEFAKEKGIAVIAANAPRRYVNIVSRMGQDALDGLSADAKVLLPPLPYAAASPAYKDKFISLMSKARSGPSATSEKADAAKPTSPAPQHDFSRVLESQSLWDASMAYSVAQALMRRPSARVYHVNGSFHTENRLGILDHLACYRPSTRSLVITVRSEKSFPAWSTEQTGAGDFVILTDPALPRSFTFTMPAASETKKEDSKETK